MPGYGLLGPQAADPYIDTAQSPLHREDLTDMAAFLAVCYAFVEQVDAFFIHHVLNPVGIREIHLYGYPISFTGLVEKVKGFREKPAGIQCEDPDVAGYPGDHMRKQLVFGTQA